MSDHLGSPAAGDGSAAKLSQDMLPLINAFAYTTGSRAHSKEFRDITGIALPAAAVRLLEHLNGRPPTPISSVARDLGLDLSRTSRLTRMLEQADHVVRIPDPDDSRRTLVLLHPAVQPVMDRWLTQWVVQHLAVLEGWTEPEIEALTAWFAVVQTCLDALLPGRPKSAAPSRWSAGTAEREKLSPARNQFAVAAIALYSWTAQARWFDAVLSGLHIDLTQQHYLTLRVVSQHEPLSVADVAERTGVDHTQASKRLKHLEELQLLDRGVDSLDRRSALYRVNQRGVELTDQIVTTQITMLENAVRAVTTAPQRAQWTDLLPRYRAALEATGAMLEI